MLTTLARKFYSQAVFRFPSEEKSVYLTFDDGPVPGATPWVLHTLDEFKIKATFFCVGDNVRKHADIYSEILKKGHTVGNHTYNHLNGWRTKNETYFDNVKKCAGLVRSNLFRPPYGMMKKSQCSMLSAQYSIIMWDVLTMDYDKKLSGQKCLQRAIMRTKPGSIVLFHDSIKAKENLFYALPRFIEHCLRKGWGFKQIAAI